MGWFGLARWLWIGAWLVACAGLDLAGWGAAWGQGNGLYQVQRPQRQVAFFDFEERRRGNFEALPMGWHPIGRRALVTDQNFHRQPVHAELADRVGFPEFNAVRFDQTHATSGTTSLMLGIDGGQAGAYLENGSITVVPGADYLVTGAVRTEGLDRGHAVIRAYFTDALGRRMPGGEATAPIRSNDEWTRVSVRLTAESERAATLGIEVALLQPRPAVGGALGPHEVVLSQVRGRAWFDDLSVWQLPFVEVSSTSATGVYRSPELPEVRAVVRDLTGRELEARTRLYDHRLRVVAEDVRGVGAGRPTGWSWRPGLERYGWYLVDLEVFERAGANRGRVARTIGGFAYLPDDRMIDEADRARFGVLAEGEADRRLDLIVEALTRARIRATTLSVWDEGTSLALADERAERVDELVERLIAAGTDVSMSLHPLPEKLADRVDGASDALAVFEAERELWEPSVVPALQRLGQTVKSWQMGRWDGGDVFFYADLESRLAGVEALLSRRVAEPVIVLPWRIDQPPVDGLSGGFRYGVHVPTSVTAEAIGGYLEGWADPGQAWLRLGVSPADRLPHERRVAELALRMIGAWAADAGRIEIVSPWTGSLTREPGLLPDPLLAVFAGVKARLGGRAYLGDLSLGQAKRARLFAGREDGVLAMWDRSASGDRAVRMVLGEAPELVDVFGNRAPVPVVDGKHEVMLGPTPVFVEGIDVRLAQLRASIEIDEPFLESEQVPHERVVTFVNPWGRTMTGQVVFTEPADWRIQPKRQFVSVAAGGTVRLPVRITFPASEVAGDKELVARLMMEADRAYDVDLTVPMEVGLSNVTFDATVALEPGPGGTVDAVATCVITNVGEEAWSMHCYATLPGHARQSLPISRLEPGQTIVRRFRFTDGAEALAASALRCGLRAINGPRMLNRRFTLDDVR